jgi:hypothetical protein
MNVGIRTEAAQFLFGEYAAKKTGKYLEGEPDVV